MEQVDIVKLKRCDVENSYKYLGIKFLESSIIKHLSFEIGLFNKRNVQMDYLSILKNKINIGCAVLVYHDKRKKHEFEYEKHILNLPETCMLKNCYIEKPFRKQGYFRYMFSKIENLAKEKGYKKIVLAVNRNNINAFQIFKHLEFLPIRSIFIDDENFVIMERQIFDT